MRRASLLLAVLAALAAVPATASAKDPGRWIVTGASSVPNDYFQGLTSSPAARSIWFTGFFQGLWKTTPALKRTAGVPVAIPPAVFAAEGYNHIGDPSWDRAEGGRIILPLECYSPSQGNTCGTGAFGVADPRTLAWRYYVKLDPAEIPKAMWAESSPDGKLIWTSSGDDLLAYRSSDVKLANRGPGGPLIHPVRRLRNAVPPTGITGAVFREGKLLLAGESNGVYKVWSINTKSGGRTLEIEMRICGESEGLDFIPTLGGSLHWLIAPFDPGCELTYGPTSALLHFVPRPAHRRFTVTVTKTEVGTLPGTVRATVRARRATGRALPDALVNFAGGKARTNSRGLATVSTRLELPGRFRAVAREGDGFGASLLIPVGLEQAKRGAPAPRRGAR